jgi:hypothetical protein
MTFMFWPHGVVSHIDYFGAPPRPLETADYVYWGVWAIICVLVLILEAGKD